MTARRRKVLVVDDSEIVREMVSIELEERGYTVVAMASPIGFTAALKREQPDLVLMDVSMPALQGDKLVDLANRSGGPGCPIVLHSDRPEAELRELVKGCGAHGYIRKTGDGAQLAQAVNQILRDVIRQRPP
jgi:CheY-like chemotaxis protein